MPANQAEVCEIVTDDTVLVHADAEVGAARLEKLDTAMAAKGIQKNVSKDISLESHIVALGCELGLAPPLVEPHSGKLFDLMRGLLDLLHNPQASPQGVNSALGVEQWFCQLHRGMYSIFDATYKFVQQEPAKISCLVPMAVQTELLADLLLLPLLPAALDREYLNKVVACDASPHFGFGVVSCDVEDEVVSDLGMLAERRGDYIRLFPDPHDPPKKDRLGTPHQLHLRERQFKVVISKRARWKAHSSILEGHALLLAVRWAMRTPKHHHERLCVLVDAKAIIGAGSKSRSSASALRGFCVLWQL